MKKLLLTILFLVLMLPTGVQALDYEANMSFDIILQEENPTKIVQKATVKNNSKDFLASSVSLSTPFKNVKVLSAQVNSKNAQVNIEDGKFLVQFLDYSLDNQETAEIRIVYETDEVITNMGSIKSFSWPKFELGGNFLAYDLEVSYPPKWKNVLYSNIPVGSISEGSEVNTIQFKQIDQKLNIFIGEYSLIESRFDIDSNTTKNKVGELSFALGNNLKFLASTKSTSVYEGEDKNDIRVNLSKYPDNPGISIISQDQNIYPNETTKNGYFSQSDKFIGIETNEPEKIYKILLSRFQPDTEITKWERNTSEETLNKNFQNDLDYANSLVSLFRSKEIPSNIVYGIAQYPDGNYYWHFWVVYLTMSEGENIWKTVDPYLEDLSGDDFFYTIPPTRMTFGTLSETSDLSELSSELFLLDIKNISFQYFDTPTANAGYITSQINKRQLPSNNDAVLGVSKEKNSNPKRIAIAFTVFSMGSFLVAVAYLTNKKFETN